MCFRSTTVRLRAKPKAPTGFEPVYSGSIDHPLYHSRIELKKCATYEIRTRAINRPADLKSAPLDQLGQSGKKVTLDVRIELTASRLTVGRSDQLS